MYVCVPECKYVHHMHPKPVAIRAMRSPELWFPMIVDHHWVLRRIVLLTTKPPPAPSYST